MNERSWESAAASVSVLSVFAFAAIKTDWRSLFDDKEKQERLLKHEITLFTQINFILPEARVIQIDESISTLQSIWEDDYRIARELVHFVEQEGNLFLDPDLRKALLGFSGSIEALTRYTGIHFFYTRERYDLYPELKRWLDSFSPDSDETKKWDSHVSELSCLCRAMRGSYSRFRNTVKTRLGQ